MRDVVEIGRGKVARRGYHLEDLTLVPSRRTRGSADVSIAWQLDAHRMDLPLMVAPSDAVVSPTTAAVVDKLGGLAVLNGEGLWTRYEEPEPVLARIVEAAEGDRLAAQRVVRDAYAAPVRPGAGRRPDRGDPRHRRPHRGPLLPAEHARASPTPLWTRALTCSSSRAR